jgi:hypothetical protein
MGRDVNRRSWLARPEHGKDGDVAGGAVVAGVGDDSEDDSVALDADDAQALVFEVASVSHRVRPQGSDRARQRLVALPGSSARTRLMEPLPRVVHVVGGSFGQFDGPLRHCRRLTLLACRRAKLYRPIARVIKVKPTIQFVAGDHLARGCLPARALDLLPLPPLARRARVIACGFVCRL